MTIGNTFFPHLLTLSAFLLATNPAHADQTDDAEAAALVAAYGSTLKAALMSAMKKAGPISAVEVCNEQAPQIADHLSNDHWQIKRISLKPRNPDNSPTDEEAAVLKQFERFQAAGSSFETLTWSGQLDGQYTFIKAIPTGGLCLTCHGENIQPKLYEKIKSHYPDDKATGYRAGDIRGAFLLKRRND